MSHVVPAWASRTNDDPRNIAYAGDSYILERSHPLVRYTSSFVPYECVSAGQHAADGAQDRVAIRASRLHGILIPACHLDQSKEDVEAYLREDWSVVTHFLSVTAVQRVAARVGTILRGFFQVGGQSAERSEVSGVMLPDYEA